MPDTLSLDQVIARFKPGMTVFVPGMSGESLALYEALKKSPDAANGVRFVGVHFPGINRSDYLGLHPAARQRSCFMLPGLRGGLMDGRAELLTIDYPAVFRDLESLAPQIDIAFAQLSPPDAKGECSLGVSADFHAAVWARARQRIAHVNPRLPRTRGSFTVRYADLDAVFELEQELLTYDGGTPNDAMRAHGALVAGLVRDGDTLEFGVGKLQAGILGALSGHRNLRVWSGMASTPVLDLLDRGVIAGKEAISIGVALGDRALYERAAADETFCFRPVSETHDVRRIAAIPRFVAINSGVEVDLFGQVNADSMNGRLVAGVGGLPAFVAGASLSEGGRSIIALPAATDDGKYSRIVPRLSGSGLVALPRHTADLVVTEHGVADLRGLDVQARARVLIAVAAPSMRDSLAAAWRELSRSL